MALIEADLLRKVYRTNVKRPGLAGAIHNLFHAQWQEKVAIDNISFSIQRGQSVACIGENGAGKSTLIKMLVGILSPTAGTVRVDGQDPMKHPTEYLRKIGVIFGQKTNLWTDIPVIESYQAVQVLYRLDKDAFDKRFCTVVERLELEPILSSPARKLSLGQRMKADIGMVLLHRPQILFLDEPTIGLDINVKHTIRQFIRQINQEEGTTVLLTSHDLDDVDLICDDALVLSQGKVFYQGSLEQLKHRFVSDKVVMIAGESTGDIGALLPAASIHVEGRKTRITYDARQYSSGELLQAISQCYAIEDITIQEPGIDDVVSRIFQEGARA